MLPPAPVPPNVVVGATIVKRFPGYGERRGTIAEIDLDGGEVIVRWATDERTTLSLGEAAKRAIYAVPPTEEEEDDLSLDGDSTIAYDSGDDTVAYDGGALTTTSSRFWGVYWDRGTKKWKAYYTDADGKTRGVGYYDDEEEAARARDQAVRDAGLEARRSMNVDAAGVLVPRERTIRLDRSAVVAPDPALDPTATTSRFWGVGWAKNARRWRADYTDATGKCRYIGLYDTQEAAAHAVNAAIRRAGLERQRHTNPVVDGALVPKQPGAPSWILWKRGRVDPTVATRPSDAELALLAELVRLKAENRELALRAELKRLKAENRGLLRAELERLKAENQKLKRRRRDEPAAATPSARVRRPRRD